MVFNFYRCCCICWCCSSDFCWLSKMLCCSMRLLQVSMVMFYSTYWSIVLRYIPYTLKASFRPLLLKRGEGQNPLVKDFCPNYVQEFGLLGSNITHWFRQGGYTAAVSICLILGVSECQKWLGASTSKYEKDKFVFIFFRVSAKILFKNWL